MKRDDYECKFYIDKDKECNKITLNGSLGQMQVMSEMRLQ